MSTSNPIQSYRAKHRWSWLQTVGGIGLFIVGGALMFVWGWYNNVLDFAALGVAVVILLIFAGIVALVYFFDDLFKKFRGEKLSAHPKLRNFVGFGLFIIAVLVTVGIVNSIQFLPSINWLYVVIVVAAAVLITVLSIITFFRFDEYAETNRGIAKRTRADNRQKRRDQNSTNSSKPTNPDPQPASEPATESTT